MNTVRIGPYLVIDIEDKEATSKKYGCNNCKNIHSPNRRNKFCSICGAKLGLFDKTYLSTPSFYELGVDEDAFLQRMYHGKFVWFDEQNDIGLRIDGDDEDMLQFDNPDLTYTFNRSGEIDEFEQAHLVDLSTLRRAGIAFEVKWGILSYNLSFAN